jgi:hypothetical protein
MAIEIIPGMYFSYTSGWAPTSDKNYGLIVSKPNITEHEYVELNVPIQDVNYFTTYEIKLKEVESTLIRTNLPYGSICYYNWDGNIDTFPIAGRDNYNIEFNNFKVEDDNDVPEEIRSLLSGVPNSRPGTPSTTNDSSQGSYGYSPKNYNDSSQGSVGGKRSRKRKNKTKRRKSRKSKRRRNKKTKRR